jgi:hypothetical protein
MIEIERIYLKLSIPGLLYLVKLNIQQLRLIRNNARSPHIEALLIKL